VADQTRTKRELESREQEKRTKEWEIASILPQPSPREGLDHRYARASSRGTDDNINISQALREGWEPVLASDYPELQVMSDRGSQYPDNVLIGGLLLMARPKEIGDQFRERSKRESETQIEALDQNFFREQDPRMPLMKPNRKTRVEFGEN
jgi:hypothetical protein